MRVFVAYCRDCDTENEFTGRRAEELRDLWAEGHVLKSKGHTVELKSVIR